MEEKEKNQDPCWKRVTNWSDTGMNKQQPHKKFRTFFYFAYLGQIRPSTDDYYYFRIFNSSKVFVFSYLLDSLCGCSQWIKQKICLLPAGGLNEPMQVTSTMKTTNHHHFTQMAEIFSFFRKWNISKHNFQTSKFRTRFPKTLIDPSKPSHIMYYKIIFLYR